MPEYVTDSVRPATFAARAADSLLRAAGGRSVLLRMPAPAVPADPAEQLGLATPAFQDSPLAPAVLRSRAGKLELLVSAAAIEALTGSLARDSASVLFRDAAGILCDDTLFAIVSATAEQAFGQPYLYRLILRAPLAHNA